MCRVSFFHTLYPNLANFAYPNPTLPYTSLTIIIPYPTHILPSSYPTVPNRIETLAAFNNEVLFGLLFAYLFSFSRVPALKLYFYETFLERNHLQRYFHSIFVAFFFKTLPLTLKIRLSVLELAGTPTY